MNMNAHPGDLLSALLDGELTPGEEEGVRTHLAGCAECRRELAFIGEGRTFVRDLPPVDPPFGLFERMLHRRSRWARGGVAALAGPAAAAGAARSPGGRDPLEEARQAAESTPFSGSVTLQWRDASVLHQDHLTVEGTHGTLLAQGQGSAMAVGGERLVYSSGNGWQ